MRVTEKVRKEIVEAVKQNGRGAFIPSLYDKVMKDLFKKKPDELLIKSTQMVKMATVRYEGNEYVVCLVDTEGNKRVWTIQESFVKIDAYGFAQTKGKWKGFFVEPLKENEGQIITSSIYTKVG